MEAVGHTRSGGTAYHHVTTAREKNRAATKALFAAELDDHLNRVTIGVVVGPTLADRLVGDALGDLLGRFWRRIASAGENASHLARAAQAAASSADDPNPIVDAQPVDADFVIGIGVTSMVDLNIAIDGYRISIGETARGGIDANPLTALVAACIAAAEALKATFADQCLKRIVHVPSEYVLDLNMILGRRIALPTAIHLSDVVMCGVGAVSHAFLWIMERWPHPVSGRLVLTDRDAYDPTNGQRYTGMFVNEGLKVNVWAKRLMRAHPALVVEAEPFDLNSYFASHPIGKLAIIGVDSEESRRHLALKLIPTIVNMWTSGESAGASLHHLDGIGRCLYCAYPDRGQHLEEVLSFSQMTGLTADRVRELLDTAMPLNAGDLEIIAHKHPELPAQEGRPLRSVIPAICSVVPIATGSNQRVIDVPLAPVSAYAGAYGFLAFLLAVVRFQGTPAWQCRLFAYPTENAWTAKARGDSCPLCSDQIALELVRERVTRPTM